MTSGRVGGHESHVPRATGGRAPRPRASSRGAPRARSGAADRARPAPAGPPGRSCARRAGAPSAPRRGTSSGQGGEELVRPSAVERELRGKLPEDRAERGAQPQDPGREEVRERRPKAAELQHVRDVAAALHREHEPVRYGGAPGLAGGRPRQGVEGAVDLDRRQSLREVRKPALRGEAAGIETAAPVRVHPAARSDTDRRLHAAREQSGRTRPRPREPQEQGSGRRRRAACRPSHGVPGGQASGRPPRRWKWRWKTLCPAPSPLFATSR